MYYEDFSLCRYHSDSYHADNWQVPLLMIGWLEAPHRFPCGATPEGFLCNLKEFVSLASTEYSHLNFRGLYYCTHCPAKYSGPQPGPIWSQEIILVPGNQVVYAAPGGIVHYVEAHAYLPPPEFIEAVMRCPAYGSPEFQEALRLANAGHPPPHVTAENFWRECEERERQGRSNPL